MKAKLALAKELPQYIGAVSSSQVKKWVAEDKFPKPIKLSEGGRLNAWLVSELEAWVEERIAAERGPKRRGKA